jgi:thymidylate synthase (FAD)
MSEHGSFNQDDALKWIEIIGRTAYKSEDKITDDSAVKFVKGIIKSGHESVLEHMTHRFVVNTDSEAGILGDFAEIQENTVGFHWSPCQNGFIVSLNVRTLRDAMRFVHNDLTDTLFNAVLPRYNVLYEDLGHSLLPKPCYDVTLISEKQVWFELSIMEAIKHIYRTVKFICDRGISHEIVRHRLCAFTQESTRYCNYSKKGTTFIMPPWGLTDSDKEFLKWIEIKYDRKTELYRQKPQQSRYWLNNGLKTELNMTANLKEWWHFFELRTPKTAHPQMRELTVPLLSDFKATVGHSFAANIVPESLEVF